MKLGGGGVIISTAQIGDGVIVNADINASAAIAYSKLNLASSIVNADISNSAAIALSKLATDPLARVNHTGTQTSSTISDFTSAVQALVSNAWTTVKKSADQSVNTDTSTNNDDELKIAMSANKSYFFRMFVIFYSTSATPDFKFDFLAPAGVVATLAFDHGGPLNDNTDGITINNANSYDQIARTHAGTGTGYGYVKIEGFCANGANAGDLNFRWAQGTSDATNVTVKKGSYIEYYEITP